MKTKYAVKVMLSKDDWIYITEPEGTMFEVRPILFNTRELAEEHAKIWDKDASKVVRWREK